MLSLKQTEIYKHRMTDSMRQSIEGATLNQLVRGIGIIAPNQIEAEMFQLKSQNKKTSLNTEAIALYESNGGRIRLFNLTNNSNASSIPAFIPFTVARAEPSSGGVPVPVVFMNLNRMGNWDNDDKLYLGLNARQDLYSVLETGIIMHKMIVEGRTSKVLENTAVVNALTKIYAFLFSKTISRTTGTSYGTDEFNRDLGTFIISKFFLQYVLGRPVDSSTDDIAYASNKLKASLVTLRESESYMDIDYTSLSDFLKTFGTVFLKDDIKLSEFERAWIQLYGEGTALTIEYVPYLLHFLFASVRGSTLGNTCKFINIRPVLETCGLSKLYYAVLAAVQR